MAVSLTGRAQDFKLFEGGDEAYARRLADSIALNAKRQFALREARYAKSDTSVYLFIYRDLGDTTGANLMKVVFSIKMIGANKDLEIRGTRTLLFDGVEGKYLDLFPAWKKFVNPSASLGSLASKGHDEVNMFFPDGREARLTLRKMGNYWRLFML